MASKKRKAGNFSNPILNLQKRISRAKEQGKSINYIKDLEISLSKHKHK